MENGTYIRCGESCRRGLSRISPEVVLRQSLVCCTGNRDTHYNACFLHNAFATLIQFIPRYLFALKKICSKKY